ncbi:MAG: hypothetical protein MRZ48_01010 [Anaerostipes hadrus]|nr:hypothetical protein [Anaerostipes hadrus]
MKKEAKKWLVMLLSICMIVNLCTPYRIQASQNTTKKYITLDDYIQAVTMEYQSGEDWIKIKDDTKNIPADARMKITINYKNIDAKELLENDQTLRYHLPELFQNGTVAINSIHDSDGNKIGTIQVEENTQDVVLKFDESFLKQDEEENKKINGNFSVYVTTDKEKVKKEPEQTITIGNVKIKLNFEEDSDARLGTLELNKTEPRYSEENGNAYLTYTLIAKTGDDSMPSVTIKDQFTKNQAYIDRYMGVDKTKISTAHHENDKNIPYEGTGDQFESKVYLQDGTAPGILTWEIGDMKAHEVRTLTYKVKLKDSYLGGASKGTITNAAKAYSKSYEHNTASSNFTSQAGMQVKKSVGSYQKDPSGNGGTITYAVYVKANDSNTYTLNNIKVYDNFNIGTNAGFFQYINYEPDSFKLYEGSKAEEGKELTIPENKHQGHKNPDIVNDKKTTCKADFYIGDLKPGEERLITYKVCVAEDIFAIGNGEIKIKNTAALYSDDTVSGGNQKFASATQEKSLGKKVWDRKLQSDPITKEEQIKIPQQDKIYDSNMEISPLSEHSFKIPKGSYQYHVVVNETGDFDVSSAIFGDALTNDYLAYTGYLKVDYYDTGLATDASNDKEAVKKLQEKTPKETFWINIHDGKQFTFSPKKLEGCDGKGAYLLTYYATPKNIDDLTQVSSGNSFTLGGNVIGPGGNSIRLPGVKVTTSTIIEGGKNFEASKTGWYYDPTKATRGDWIRGSLYWIIEVGGNEIPAGTTFRDVPKAGNVHYIRGTSMVGVYKGKLPTGKSFKDYYGTVEDLKGDSQLQKLTGNENNGGTLPKDADYQWESIGSNVGRYADIKLKKDIHLEEGEHLYIILRTEPNRTFSLRDGIQYNNELQTKDSNATDFVSQGEASLLANGGGNNFKEVGGIYERDDANQWKTIKSVNWNSASRLRRDLITEAGTYIDWRLKLNYVGNISGKVFVEDQLPKGLDLTYVRYFWIDPGIRNDKDMPVMKTIDQYENDPQWKKLEMTGKLNGDNGRNYTSIAYYNQQTGKLCMAVDNLKSGGSKDKRSLEIQVVTRISDEGFLLDGQTKNFANSMTVKTEEGKDISTSTAIASASKKTITKTKQDVKDGKLPFTITVNESGEDLVKGEDTITLVDEMNSPLQFDTDSVKIKDKNGNEITGISPKIETTSTGQKMSLTIPDSKKLVITYEAILSAPPDTDIKVSNKAYWFGHSTNIATIDNTTIRYHVEATAGTTTSPMVKVKKVDKEDTSKVLSGATFMVQEDEYNELTKTWEPVTGAKIHTEDTDDTGIATFGKKDALSYNKVYCLRETKAPEGYVLDATPKYFAIAQKEGEAGEESYPAQLAMWQKQGVEVYYLGSTYKCTMYDSKGELKVDKQFINEKGEKITAKDLPDTTCSFGLYEYKGANIDYRKEQKLQTLTITSKNGVLSYKCNGVSTDQPRFTGLPVEGTFAVYELDENGDPILESGTSYQPENGFAFEVTYKKDKASYVIKSDGTSDSVEITNKYYTVIHPETGVWSDQMKLYILMAGIGILAILLIIIRKTRFRGRDE